MRTLILGGFGLLGRDIYHTFENAGHQTVRMSKDECDITDIESLKTAITKYQPELIIHAAGLTNVDMAEDTPMYAYNVNSLSMYNLLQSFSEIKPVVIFFSTDYVFDGNQGVPYREESPCRPLNIYGRSKLLAEDILRANYEKYYIVRTSWLFGKGGKCFPDTIAQKLLQETSVLSVVDDQFGCPTYTVDLAESLFGLLDCPYGIYNVTNSGSTSWYEFARLVAREININDYERRVQPVHSNGYLTKAIRPSYSVLDNTKWEAHKYPLRHFSEALHSFLINE